MRIANLTAHKNTLLFSFYVPLQRDIHLDTSARANRNNSFGFHKPNTCHRSHTMEVEENIYLSNVTSYYEKRANMEIRNWRKKQLATKSGL